MKHLEKIKIGSYQCAKIERKSWLNCIMEHCYFSCITKMKTNHLKWETFFHCQKFSQKDKFIFKKRENTLEVFNFHNSDFFG